MHWKSDYSENNTLIARFVQTILEFLYLPILSNYSLSFNIINFLKENSKKTQRKLKESKYLFTEVNYFYILKKLTFPVLNACGSGD